MVTRELASKGPFCARPPTTLKPVDVWLTVLLLPPPQAVNTSKLIALSARCINFFMVALTFNFSIASLRVRSPEWGFGDAKINAKLVFLAVETLTPVLLFLIKKHVFYDCSIEIFLEGG